MNLKNYLLKKLLKWANKKCKNFNIYNVVFFVKKIKKNNTWRYRYFTHVYWISSWYELQFLRYRVPHTEIGSYGSFFGLLPLPLLLKTNKQKNNRILKWRNCFRHHYLTHIYTCVPKTTITWGTVPEIQIETEFFVILDHILLFYPTTDPKN